MAVQLVTKREGLTGGATGVSGDVDGISATDRGDGNALQEGDLCDVVVSGNVFNYKYSSGTADVEDSPYLIKPDTGAASGYAWILQNKIAGLDTSTTVADADKIEVLKDSTGLSVNMARSDFMEHDIAYHDDTTATGAELNTLTDDSMADSLHRHSELVASDGSPGPALSTDASGNVNILNNALVGASGTPSEIFEVAGPSPSIKIISDNDGGLVEFKMFADRGDDNSDIWSLRADVDNTWKLMNLTTGTWLSKVEVGSDGAIQFTDYGAGTLSTDASGNITASSDENLKTNFEKLKADKAIKIIKEWQSIYYNWSEESGLDTETRQLGFGARNLNAACPEAGTCVKKKKVKEASSDKKELSENDIEDIEVWGVYDRAIIAVQNEVIKDLLERVEKLEKGVK